MILGGSRAALDNAASIPKHRIKCGTTLTITVDFNPIDRYHEFVELSHGGVPMPPTVKKSPGEKGPPAHSTLLQ